MKSTIPISGHYGLTLTSEVFAATKPLSAIHHPRFQRSKLRIDDVILQSLVISLPVVMFTKLIDRPSQRSSANRSRFFP
jgi:hypothetical protein